MPLTTGELSRIRTELGYNVLDVGAEPYVGISAIFGQVVQRYLREGAETTSATAITTTGGAVAVTLASAVGVGVFEHVGLDVDGLFERVTVRSIAGNVIAIIPSKLHPSGYPVTVDNGLLQVREVLASLHRVHQQIDELNGTGGLRKVDEVEFYDARGKSRLDLFRDQLEHWRDRLSDAIGVQRNVARSGSQGGSVALY